MTFRLQLCSLRLILKNVRDRLLPVFVVSKIITQQPSADTPIKHLACNGELYIGDSKVQIKRKVKTEHNEIQTMHIQKCLLRKIYQREALNCLIKIRATYNQSKFE